MNKFIELVDLVVPGIKILLKSFCHAECLNLLDSEGAMTLNKKGLSP
jgi:hypothetical protein